MGYEIIDEMFKGENPKSVFEMGCSAGSFLKEFKEKGVKVGGLDIEPNKYLVHDATKPWPLEDKSWDIVFSVGVLIYIKDPLPVIKEMLRVGKKVILAERDGEDKMDCCRVKGFKHDENFIITEEWWEGDIHIQYLHNYKRLFKLCDKDVSVKFFKNGKDIIKTL